MSINVTVSGNPVRINRGKMVTSYDPIKSEFEKRRLMRLEQVRQQSKDIAENVRNKYKKEKSKCISQLEKEGEARLQKWKTRKLLELQDQCQENLDYMGFGHKGAERVEVEEEDSWELEESRERLREERGRGAAQKLQIERNEDSLKKAVPIQRKKMVRDEENSRSDAVVNLRKIKQKKSPFKKKKKKQQVFDSDSENRVPQLEGFGDDSDLRVNSESEEMGREAEERKTFVERQTSVTDLQVPTREKAAQTLHQGPYPCTTSEFPFDTRISERIKRRAILNPKDDYCNFAEKGPPKEIHFCPCCHCSKKEITTFEDPSDSPVKEDKSVRICPCCECHKKESHRSQIKTVDVELEIRKKSSVYAADDSSRPIEKSDSSVRDPVFDDVETQKPNRSLGRSGPETSDVQKPDASGRGENSLRSKTVSPQRKVDRRVPHKSDQTLKSTHVPSKPKVTLKSTKDRAAHIEIEPSSQPVQYYEHSNRYSKSYLPKTSYIEKINEDSLVVSPNILSEEEIVAKMRQRDREAQLRGQVALEKERIYRECRELMKKLPTLQNQERIAKIGLDKEKYHMSASRLEEMEKKRQNRLDNAYEELFVRKDPATVTLSRKTSERDEDHCLNLAWDVDFPPKETSSQSRSEQLSHLLSSLKSHKDRLMEEFEKTSSQLTKRSDEVKSKSTHYTRVKTKRKRTRDERPPSPPTTDMVNEEESTVVSKTKSSKTTVVPSPRKKFKTSRKVLVLQNMSTQTTPVSHSVATSPHMTTPIPETNPLDDLCEIVIKIKEDEKPEVVVNPPFLGKTVKVISETEKSATDESKKPVSWRDELSRTSSSTSYYDPPHSDRSQKSVLKKPTKSFEEASKSINSTVSSGTSKQLDPRLLTYIKKLLNMSRASIDDLTVSATSDVSTPSHSVVETPSNNPLLQLLNVMRYHNLSVSDLQKQLSYESNGSSRHYNTNESVTVHSSTSEGDRSVQFKSCTEIDSSSKLRKKDSDKKLQQYEDIAGITATCTKRISSLEAMIEKVRAEKEKIKMRSTSSSSDKDLTLTSYKLLEKKQDDSSSPKQDEMDKKLLTIDYGYAEKLKQLSKEELEKEKQRAESTDGQLFSRLQSLLKDNKTVAETSGNAFMSNKDGKTVALSSKKKLLTEKDSEGVELVTEKRLLEDSKDDKTVGLVSEQTTVTLKPSDDNKASSFFIPLLDIPKLPRLETLSLDKKKKKHPPTTKSVRPISEPIVPHELSTIIEADSQISTKIDSPVKKASPSKSRSAMAESPKSVTRVKSQSSTNSSDDVSEMETMETMLVSIGMEWAIPTLKKTREALALTSSSSGSKESAELSLREFLSKISSSSDGGLSLSDTQGISLIHDDNRMTSTPIPGFEKKEGLIFATDSDLSSVKEQSNPSKSAEQRYFEMLHLNDMEAEKKQE